MYQITNKATYAYALAKKNSIQFKLCQTSQDLYHCCANKGTQEPSRPTLKLKKHTKSKNADLRTTKVMNGCKLYSFQPQIVMSWTSTQCQTEI